LDNPEIPNPLFREAVSAIDAGDVSALERLLATHPELVCDRLDYGEGYFRQPYLLWFVAENPIRQGRLPGNIVEITRTILQAAERQQVESWQEQLDYALELVASGRVARECGVQGELLDLLAEAGADPDRALVPALAHHELAAAERLLERGARLTLLAAVCTGRTDDVTRLLREASGEDRQAALAGAALYGQAPTLCLMIERGVDLQAYSPAGLHPHGTALHHAVAAGSLDAVQVLVAAGAGLDTRDRIHQGTPLDWADHLRQPEIAAYLREAEAAYRPTT
jgi:peptide-methionine (S)-S-oxide reductase